MYRVTKFGEYVFALKIEDHEVNYQEIETLITYGRIPVLLVADIQQAADIHNVSIEDIEILSQED